MKHLCITKVSTGGIRANNTDIKSVKTLILNIQNIYNQYTTQLRWIAESDTSVVKVQKHV